MLDQRALIACGLHEQSILFQCPFLPESTRWNRTRPLCRPGEAPFGVLPKSRRCPRTSNHDRFALVMPDFRCVLALRLEFERKTTRESSVSLVSKLFEVLRMEDSLPKIWRNHIVSSKACIVESGLIGVDRYAAGVLDNYRLRYRVGNPAKFAFILPQSLLTLLEIFDVSAYSVPHNDLLGFVAEGFEANEEPTKDPIMAAHARFDFAWFSGNQQLAPSPHQ